MLTGNVYTHKDGTEWECKVVYGRGTARLTRVKDKFTLLAHDIVFDSDGKFEWCYSTGGFFDE